MAQREPAKHAAAARSGVGVAIDPDLQRCIDECLHCHGVCLAMASRHCLVHGGEHVEPGHFRLMLACAETCRAAAAMMMIGGDLMHRLCAVCADACTACAESCRGLAGMERCVEACRSCADACRQMAS
jgi:hypothetical protein